MSALKDLIDQIQDKDLREKIRLEVSKALDRKKFGLVFENHLQEYTNSDLSDSTYPCLDFIDSISRAPASDLWHILIEADNYFALRMLEYLYLGKVDCIYIDPPYNTGAKDWKYNNDYVDSSDRWRHSKWLSMMEKRLRIAKRLLNPEDSVLICTIDEKEYLHLGMLLEEMFPEARMQMVSSCIMPGGVSRAKEFSRSDEYIFFVKIGESAPIPLQLSDEWLGGVKNTSRAKVHWESLLRTGIGGMRKDSPNLFYPVLVSKDGKHFMGVGEPLKISEDKNSYTPPEGTIAIWPIHTDGSEGRWRIGRETLIDLQKNHVVKLGGFTPRGMSINYLKKGEYAKVLDGTYKIQGINEDNSYQLDDSDYIPSFVPLTQWTISTHDASRHGSGLLRKIFCDKVFSFPKSLYAVHDCIRFFVANKPNALILDFFAGSGTTLHAVNLLNTEDGGHRRCILVTNNEVSVEEAKSMSAKGLKPGDEEWERLGIARYVTWPRTVCAIKGVDIKGEPLKGTYLGGSDLPMADGFMANAIFFKLNFLKSRPIDFGKEFKRLLPILWMKSGGIGSLPNLDADPDHPLPPFISLPQNKMAILLDYKKFNIFRDEVKEYVTEATIFIVSDSRDDYRAMASNLKAKAVYQLYRDYLEKFKFIAENNENGDYE